MFGLSLSEIVVIALAALIVIGPERLPKTARTLGLLMGRAQRYVSDIKNDIEREMHVDDIKKFKDEVASSVTSAKSSVEGEITSITNPLKKMSNPLETVKSEVKDLEKQLKSDLNPLPDLKDLGIDETAKNAPSTPIPEKQQAVETSEQHEASVTTTAAAVHELSQPSSTVSSIDAKPTKPTIVSTKAKELPDPTVSGALIYPDEVDDRLARGADFAQLRDANDSTIEKTDATPSRVSGFYDGPVFEPLLEPSLATRSAEEQEAADQAWRDFVEHDVLTVDADDSLEGLSIWEQMPQKQTAEGAEGLTVATTDSQNKKDSNSDDGDLNV